MPHDAPASKGPLQASRGLISGAARWLPLLLLLERTVRVALFFDGKNFYRGLCATDSALEVDYDRLAKWVVTQVGGAGAEYVGAYYYTGFYEESATDRQGFARFLSNLNLRSGYFVRREPRVRRRHVCRFCGKGYYYRTEKRVDSRLVADMIHYAAIQAYDVAVLLSGDQDLVPAVEAADRLGRRVYVATWGHRGLSRALRGCCFGEIDLCRGVADFSTGRRPPRLSRDEAAPTSGSEIAQGRRVECSNDDVLAELTKACSKLPHVSRWYFEQRWRGLSMPPQQSEARRNAVAQAIADSVVETYEYDDSKGRRTQGLRPKIADGPAPGE